MGASWEFSACGDNRGKYKRPHERYIRPANSGQDKSVWPGRPDSGIMRQIPSILSRWRARWKACNPVCIMGVKRGHTHFAQLPPCLGCTQSWAAADHRSGRDGTIEGVIAVYCRESASLSTVINQNWAPDSMVKPVKLRCLCHEEVVGPKGRIVVSKQHL